MAAVVEASIITTIMAAIEVVVVKVEVGEMLICTYTEERINSVVILSLSRKFNQTEPPHVHLNKTYCLLFAGYQCHSSTQKSLQILKNNQNRRQKMRSIGASQV